MAETDRQPDDDSKPKVFPKGVVLGPDGKPCRSCTSFAAWAAMTKGEEADKKPAAGQKAGPDRPSPTRPAGPDQLRQQARPKQPCPPDSEELGRNAWSLLHSITASYPKVADGPTQAAAQGFIAGLARLYPCWSCATHFDEYIRRDEQTRPKVGGRAEFGWWMCMAHNDVNKRLGKPDFDCNRWEERWAAKGREDEC